MELKMTYLRSIDLGTVKSFAILSDVHLRNPHDQNTSLFIETLRKLQGVEAVFLLGDIFDFIFVPKLFYVKYWHNVFESLTKLKESGTKIFFIEGNHDFGFEHFFPKELKDAFSHVGDAEFTISHPFYGKIALRHGDDIVCPQSYLWFRKLVKSKMFQRAVKMIPGRAMHVFFSSYALLSRKADKYNRLTTDFLSKTVVSYLTPLASDKIPAVLILGHIHVYVDSFLGKTKIIAGPDWLTCPSVLYCDSLGNFRRDNLGRQLPPLFPVGEQPPC
jgi:UDP-2,3-diacylglucosamine hydrolase